MKLSMTASLWLTSFAAYLILCSILLLALGEPDYASLLFAAFMFMFAGGLCFCFADRAGPLTSTVPEFLILFNVLLAVLFLQEFLLGHVALSALDAFFISVALITTTNAELIMGLDQLGYSQHLLRAGAQVLGALWIIHFSVVAVPTSLLGASQPSAMRHRSQVQRVTQFLSATSRGINIVFASLLLLSTAAFALAGATALDAMALAAATVSLGGFLPKDASMLAFGPGVASVAMVVMILSACSYTRYIHCIHSRQISPFLKSSEIRAFFSLLTVFVVIAIAGRYYVSQQSTESVLGAVFTVVSTATTTGLFLEDPTQHGSTWILVFLIALVGGCSGSPSGGFRMARAMILYQLFQRQFRWEGQALRSGALRVPQTAMDLVPLLFMLWLLAAGAGTWALTLSGLDGVSAMTSSIACLTNTGLALGELFARTGTYSDVPDSAKWSLIVLMLVGRLEFGVVLVFLTRSYWTVRALAPLGLTNRSTDES